MTYPFDPDYGPECKAASPHSPGMWHCTCVLPFGHDGTHRCNCGAEWLAPDTEEGE